MPISQKTIKPIQLFIYPGGSMFSSKERKCNLIQEERVFQ